jgi:catechol 2,3-dioxygenase-like lactoylglutathione lyase family enzyme
MTGADSGIADQKFHRRSQCRRLNFSAINRTIHPAVPRPMRGKLMIVNPRLAVLYVSDQRRTLEFLTGTLGFDVVADTPYGDGRRWVEVRPPGAQTCVAIAAVEPAVLETLQERAGRMTHGWFDCDDLDVTCDELRKQDVEVIVEPQATPWREGGRWAQIRGHDGHVYGLTERGH